MYIYIAICYEASSSSKLGWATKVQSLLCHPGDRPNFSKTLFLTRLMPCVVGCKNKICTHHPHTQLLIDRYTDR